MPKIVPSKPSTPAEPEKTTTTYTFTANPSSLSFPAEGGTKTFALSTKASWVSSCTESWVSYAHTEGEGNETITVTVGENTDTQKARTASITFKAAGDDQGSVKVTISQEKAKVTTKIKAEATSKITLTSAMLNGSYEGAGEGCYEKGFRYGTSQSELDREIRMDGSQDDEGPISAQISGLDLNTTYYYQPFITVWSASENQYVDIPGDIKSFKTGTGALIDGTQFLVCNEIPAVSLKNSGKCSGSSFERFGDEASWYQYETTNENQLVVTHTYNDNGKTVRNWTALVDKTRMTPLWSAFVMNTGAYPDNGVGRADNWVPDPAVPESWQRCIAGKIGSTSYSRGHLVASEYRQASKFANKQTFYYTNQALQEQNGFNGSVWAALESAVSSHSPSVRDTLYVTVGVLYGEPVKMVTPNAGGDAVLAPSHFYTCLMLCKFDTSGSMTDAKGIAYIYTNESHAGQKYPSGATTIDAVEAEAGFDFFTNVPSALQEAAEKMSASLW